MEDHTRTLPTHKRLDALEEVVNRLERAHTDLAHAIASHTRQIDELEDDLVVLQNSRDVYRHAHNSMVSRVDEHNELLGVLNKEQIPQIIRNFDNHDQHFAVIYRKLGLEFDPDQRVSAAEADAALNSVDDGRPDCGCLPDDDDAPQPPPGTYVRTDDDHLHLISVLISTAGGETVRQTAERILRYVRESGGEG